MTLMQQESKQMREENRQLRELIETQHSASTSSPPSREAPKKTLVLGDSVLSGLDDEKIQDVKIIQVTSINEMEELRDEADKVIICTGGDEIAKENYNEEEAANACAALIVKAKEICTDSKNVTVSSILPCSKSTQIQRQIDALNSRVENLTTVHGVSFSNHDLHFKLANGEVNDGYLHVDGQQLSRCGRRRFVADLGLSLKDSAKGDPSKTLKPKRKDNNLSRPSTTEQNSQVHTSRNVREVQHPSRTNNQNRPREMDPHRVRPQPFRSREGGWSHGSANDQHRWHSDRDYYRSEQREAPHR
jgi:hypothetical protein